jgi:hypothetical protein
MSFEESLRSVSLLADASVAGYTGVPGLPGSASPNGGDLYKLVKVTGKHTVGLCTADTDLCIGVLQNKPQVVGQAATVAIRGITNVIAGANNLAVGTQVTSDGSGRVVAATSGDRVAGILLAASTAVDEMVPMLIDLGTKA